MSHSAGYSETGGQELLVTTAETLLWISGDEVTYFNYGSFSERSLSMGMTLSEIIESSLQLVIAHVFSCFNMIGTFSTNRKQRLGKL